jgi:hypothetical protein
MASFEAFLFIGPASEFDDPSPREIVGIQRHFVGTCEIAGFPDSSIAPDFALTNLASDIAHAVFGCTGDEDLHEIAMEMVRMRCNVKANIGNGMAIAVYPARMSANVSDAEPIDYHTDTHREN